MQPQDIAYCVVSDQHLADARTHNETYTTFSGEEVLLPLSNQCLEFPKKEHVAAYTHRVLGLDLEAKERGRLLTVLGENLFRYKNPKPVIVGLIFPELTDTGGTVMIGRRNKDDHIGAWTLLSGFIEWDKGDWQSNLQEEGFEEANTNIHLHDETLVEPLTFCTPPRKDLMLNFAVVYPAGVTAGAFTSNSEMSECQHFEFSQDQLPPFGMTTHMWAFERFCHQHFGWPPRIQKSNRTFN